MAKKKVVKKKIAKKSVTSRGSARKSQSGGETLSKDWKLGEIAWNDEGNIVILQPRLAEFLRKKALEDREFEMAIPKSPVRVGGQRGGGARYQPYPNDPPVGGKGFRPPLELCVCDYLRFHLVKEIAVDAQLLSSKRAR